MSFGVQQREKLRRSPELPWGSSNKFFKKKGRGDSLKSCSPKIKKKKRGEMWSQTPTPTPTKTTLALRSSAIRTCPIPSSNPISSSPAILNHRLPSLISQKSNLSSRLHLLVALSVCCSLQDRWVVKKVSDPKYSGGFGLQLPLIL